MIFYFSGTGNSLFAAKKVASATGDRIVKIADMVRDSRFEFALSAGEKIGFVMPVYFWGLPLLVREFIGRLKLSNYSGNYCYCVFTCGLQTGNAPEMLKGDLARAGISLSASFAVPMIDNYVLMYDMPAKERQDEALSKADRELDGIIAGIVNSEIGLSSAHRGLLPFIKTPALYPLYAFGRRTKKFHVGESCTHCGLCERLCPRGTIRMEGGSPIWTKKACEHCLACIHRCPARAIQYGDKTRAFGRYAHPGAGAGEN